DGGLDPVQARGGEAGDDVARVRAGARRRNVRGRGRRARARDAAVRRRRRAAVRRAASTGSERTGRARSRRAGVAGGAMRIACVFVPQLALQAVLRRTPDARGGPVAVLEANGAATAAPGKARANSREAEQGFASHGPKTKRVARVTQFSPEARREGVRDGMT